MQILKAKESSKQSVLFICMLVFFYLLTFVLFLLDEGLFSFLFFIEALLVLLCCLFVVFSEKKNGFLNPLSFFIISTFFFIIVRPIFYSLSIAENVNEVITAGYSIDKNYLFYSLFVVNICSALTILSCLLLRPLCKSITVNIYDLYFYNGNVSRLFMLSGVIFTGVFLIKSYSKFILLGDVSVFEVDKYGLHDDLYWFTFAKYSYIVSLLFAKRKDFIFYSLLIFLASIGYIMVGLRGYTISYAFLLLFFLDLRYKLKFRYLLVFAILVAIVSSLILNYRIGIEVNRGFWEMIFNPLLQQGASFETVYGVLKYHSSVLNCISYYDYFFSIKDIGSCIDSARGIYFAEGGSFATSFYSELIYFGWFIGGIALFLFSFSLSFIQSCYDCIVKNKRISANYTYKLILFLLLPNLIYFARSSLFDFSIKLVFVLFFIILLWFMKKTLVNVK